MALFLFDVDNTLVNTRGAGGKAMKLAFRDLFDIGDGFQGVEFSGRTDSSIFREGLILHGIPDADFPALLRRFEEAYIDHLARTLTETEGHVLPGIHELVDALAAAPGARAGLATGNFRRGAMLKLEYYGLPAHLNEGGFGEDAEDRGEMVALAVRRLGGGAPVFVIGDTPLDIEAAHANGHTAVAVATGRYDLEALRRAGADILFPDLGDVEAVMERLLGEGAP